MYLFFFYLCKKANLFWIRHICIENGQIKCFFLWWGYKLICNSDIFEKIPPSQGFDNSQMETRKVPPPNPWGFLSKPIPNSTWLNSKQLTATLVTRVEVRHSSRVFPPTQTFQPLLDMLGSWNLAQTLTRLT